MQTDFDTLFYIVDQGSENYDAYDNLYILGPHLNDLLLKKLELLR